MTTRTYRDYFTPGPSPRDRAVFTIARILDFIFSVIYSLFGIRLLLDFFGAKKSAGFYELIQRLSDPLYAPFQGLFGSTSVEGHPVVWPYVVAILGYMVLHGLIRGVLHLLTREPI